MRGGERERCLSRIVGSLELENLLFDAVNKVPGFLGEVYILWPGEGLWDPSNLGCEPLVLLTLVIKLSSFGEVSLEVESCPDFSASVRSFSVAGRKRRPLYAFWGIFDADSYDFSMIVRSFSVAGRLRYYAVIGTLDEDSYVVFSARVRSFSVEGLLSTFYYAFYNKLKLLELSI